MGDLELHHDASPRDESDALSLELVIGRTVRTLRLRRGLTVSRLSEAADLSVGMLSKIENGITSPSLKSLQSVARALNVSVGTLFRGFEDGRRSLMIQANALRFALDENDRVDLGDLTASDKDITTESVAYSFKTEEEFDNALPRKGLVCLSILEGAVVIHHDEELHILQAGDTLLYDVRYTSGPSEITRGPVRCVVMSISSL